MKLSGSHQAIKSLIPPLAGPRSAAQRHKNRIVQPHDRGGARPDEIAHRLVVTLDHPRVVCDEGLDALAKIGTALPGLSPGDPIELVVVAAETSGQRAAEVRLARSGAADDDNPRMFR